MLFDRQQSIPQVQNFNNSLLRHRRCILFSNSVIHEAAKGAGINSSLLHRSSAVEIALKMAFRAFIAQHPQQDASRLEVVGIAEGYHGDTLGCMDAVAPSVYNGPRQTPW